MTCTKKNYFRRILKTTIIEKVAFGSPSRIVISFPNQLYWPIYHSNSRSYKGLSVVNWYIHIKAATHLIWDFLHLQTSSKWPLQVVFPFWSMFWRALKVLEMTVKFQVNSFYSSRAILVPSLAGSRLIKHSFDIIWPVPRKLLPANIEDNKHWESGIWQSI